MNARSEGLLVDTSAWFAARRPPIAPLWEEAVTEDRVVMCAQVELEILYTARNADDYEELSAELSALPHVELGPDVFERALEVQRRLAHVGGLHHRSVSIADLVIAAAAELAGIGVWHYDEDYDRVAAITGQRTVWIARRGSL